MEYYMELWRIALTWNGDPKRERERDKNVLEKKLCLSFPTRNSRNIVFGQCTYFPYFV